MHLQVSAFDTPARLPRDMWIVLLWYAAAYGCYRIIIGIPFDTGVLSDMHFLDFSWLKDDLPGSLLYLHAQPPLMNLLVGLSLAFWVDHVAAALEIFYFLAGIAGLLLLFFAMVRLGIRCWIRLAVCLFICSFPTFVMYQTWAYSAHLEFCIFAATIYYVACFCSGYKPGASYVKLFFTLCLLGFLRSHWHLVIYLGLFAGIGMVERGITRRQVMMACLVCFLPLSTLYTKNLIMFGFWGPSSWLGAGMADVAARLITQEEQKAMMARGEVSADFPALYYGKKIVGRVPDGSIHIQHVSLQAEKYHGWFNHNYLGMVASSRQDLHDALFIIKTHPWDYLRVGWNNLRSLGSIPSLAYNFTAGHRPLMQALTSNTATDYHALPQYMKNIFREGAFALYVLLPCTLLLLALIRKPEFLLESGRQHFIFYVFYVCAAFILISCFLNNWEQERMRWGVAPAYFCLLAISLECVQQWLLKRKRN